MVTESPSNRRETIERWLARPMFVLAFVFLLFAAGLIHRARHFETVDWNSYEAKFLLGGVAVLWPIFLVEAVLRFFLHDRSRWSLKTLGACLIAGFLPPLRLASRSATQPGRMWLPWLGWQDADFDLEKTLEHAFGAPMLVIALMILPVLTVEYGWAAAIESNPALLLILSAGIAMIWFAFTMEFIVRISATEDRKAYAIKHWVDLAVVLLPMFEFMPFLRLVRITRVMRFDTILAWVKYYRLYGLAGKGWRGLVVLQLIHELVSRAPESRLTRFRLQLLDKEKQREATARELDREIDYYRRKIQAIEQNLATRDQGSPEQPPLQD